MLDLLLGLFLFSLCLLCLLFSLFSLSLPLTTSCSPFPASYFSCAVQCCKVGDGVYDTVVLCTGFVMDVSMFDTKSKCVPNMESRSMNALPRLRPNFESWNIPHLFFNGALAHGRDVRRGNGGTLRGFRYTSRALFRTLQQLEQHEQNRTVKKITKKVRLVVERCNDDLSFRTNRVF